MFADDTTVCLTKDDDYASLQSIIHKWCTASGAKFNTTKTEIIPIGSHDYRKDLYNTHVLNPNHPPLPANLQIAKDGTAIRILGAWLGNNVDENTIWSPILETIDKCLERWVKTHPSVDGKKTITQ